MDYFTDLLAMFLHLDHFKDTCCLCRVRELSDFIRSILICVLKMKVLRVWNNMTVSN